MSQKMTFPGTLLVLVGSTVLGLSCASSPAPSAESGGTAAAAPAASGGAAPAAAPAAPAAGGAAPAAAPVPLKNLPGMTVTWKDLDQDGKKQYMKKAIMPRMGDEFAAFSSKYNEFTC